MKLDIVWKRPIPLGKVADGGLIYSLEEEMLERIPKSAGIYIFARRWGNTYEALYVGQSENLHGRVRSQLNNLRLMRHIEDANNGKRVVIIGEVFTHSGQRFETVLNILESAFIRHFLSEGHDLSNKHGARIRRHEINSEGQIRKAFIPRMVYLEKKR